MQVNIQQFIDELEPELEGLPPKSLKENVNYRDLEGWSSMHALIVIAFADSRFNVTITGEDLRACPTVKHLYDLISSRLAS